MKSDVVEIAAMIVHRSRMHVLVDGREQYTQPYRQMTGIR